MSRRSAITAITGLVFLVIYMGGYLALSLRGAYMPAATGTNGIKWWSWTPHGFAEESGTLRVGLVIPFYPLYWLDSRFWHNDWTGRSGPLKIPVRAY